MTSETIRITRTEATRWFRDPVILIAVVAVIVSCAMLSYIAVLVATGVATGDGNGIQLQTDSTLTPSSTNQDLVSMARTSVSLLLPIAAIIIGVRFAGGEMTSGALLQLGVAARRLRLLFSARLVFLLVIAGFSGGSTALVTLAATDLAAARASDLAHLNVWSAIGSLITGATLQTIVISILAFGLSALTRRWIVIAICMLVYVVGLEPALSNVFKEASAWLPWAATSELMRPQPDMVHVAPTAVFTVLVVILAVSSLRRDRASR